MEYLRKVATAEDDTLDPDGAVVDAEKDDIVARNGEPGVLADIKPELIVLGSVANTLKCFADFLDEADSAAWVVLGDPVGDFFQVTFDEAGECEAHDYSFVPAASARA